MRKLFVLLILLITAGVIQVHSQTRDFQVIGNNTGLREVTLKECKAIFKGKYSNWKNQEQVIIVLPTSKNSIAESIAKNIFDGSIKSMQKYWLSLVFQGRGNPPVFLENDQETIQFIQKNPGAIGFISNDTKVSRNLIIELK
jgi:ABC-type phosphate transport system substrate-binding protein